MPAGGEMRGIPAGGELRGIPAVGYNPRHRTPDKVRQRQFRLDCDFSGSDLTIAFVTIDFP